MKTLLLLSLLLAACASPAQIPVLEPVSNAEIIRRADGLTATAAGQTATAAAMATQNGQATAERIAVLEAVADRARATEVELQHRQAAALATSQQFERDLSATRIVAGATSGAGNVTATAQTQATAQALAHEREQAGIRNSEQNGDTMRTVVLAVVLVGAVIVILLAGSAAIGARMYFDIEKQRRSELHEFDLMRLKLEALSRAMRESRAGTVVPQLEGPPLVLPPAHPASGSSLLDGAMSDLPPVEAVIINAGDDSYTVGKFTPAEETAWAEMLALVEASIEYWNGQSRVGHRERQVVTDEKLGWSPNRWQKARNLFDETLISKPGKGTFPADERLTLGDLRRTLKSGRLSPRISENKFV